MAPPSLVPFVAGSPTRLSWFLGVDTWIAYLNAQIAAIPTTVLNGSFGLYTGSAGVGIPDEWVFTPFTTGAGALDAAVTTKGLYSFKITCLGGGGSNGGGRLDSYVSGGGGGGALVPVNPLEDFWASWWYITNPGTLSDKVEVFWYQENGSASGITISSVLWSATSGQPTAAWQQNAGTIPVASIPSDARFYSLRFTGGVAGAAAGIVWYADVKSGFQPTAKNKKSVFNAGGSFIVPTDVFNVCIEVFGASGNGTDGGSAGGGGGGGYSEIASSVVPGQSIAVTIGAPGSTTSCGGASVTSGGNATTSGGAGGVASGGTYNINGAAGQSTSGGGGQVVIGGQGVLGAPNGGAGNAGGAATPQPGIGGKVIISY